MSKIWLNGDIITDAELNRIETTLETSSVLAGDASPSNWDDWESAFKGSTLSKAISNTEVDITSYLGSLPFTSFGDSPIVYDSASNCFKASPKGKKYSFIVNLRLSGSISGSAQADSTFILIIRRKSNGTEVTSKQFAKLIGAGTTISNSDMISFITRVYGDTDPYVTGGFTLHMARQSGTQTLTLAGNQAMFLNK